MSPSIRGHRPLATFCDPNHVKERTRSDPHPCPAGRTPPGSTVTPPRRANKARWRSPSRGTQRGTGGAGRRGRRTERAAPARDGTGPGRGTGQAVGAARDGDGLGAQARRREIGTDGRRGRLGRRGAGGRRGRGGAGRGGVDCLGLVGGLVTGSVVPVAYRAGVARRKRRRRRGRGTDTTGLLLIVGALGSLLLVQQAQAHPLAAILIAAGLVAAAGAGFWFWDAGRRRLAAHEREVAVTDGMSGDQFEHFTARLMRASGFRAVQVVGGSGDMGADVVARTPDGRRVVVQCKRFAGNLGSPHVQRFAGTARDIHGAEVALLVTTGRPTAQAREVASRCRITLIDRPALAQWLTTRALDC